MHVPKSSITRKGNDWGPPSLKSLQLDCHKNRDVRAYDLPCKDYRVVTAQAPPPPCV